MSATADILEVETPEHVVLEYPLAGVMSRIVALSIDLAIQLLILLALAGLALLAVWGGEFGEAVKSVRNLTGAALAAIGLLAFVTLWGYYVGFEILKRGQTPGKMITGLRVIRDGGYALGAGEVIVRNLLRLVDIFPLLPVLGLVVMSFSRKTKRIGDYVAGTIVIRDLAPVRPAPPLKLDPLRGARVEEAVVELRRVGVHRLPSEEVRLVEEFLERRALMAPHAREAVARDLAELVAPALGVGFSHPELFLQAVFVARREGAGEEGDPFLKARQAEWDRLARASASIAANPGAAGGSAELLEFVRLYRRATTDVARARTARARPDVVRYINQLVGRIHVQIYAARAFSFGGILRYFLEGFPAAIRRNARWVAVSIGLTAASAVPAYVAVEVNPALARVIVSSQLVDTIDEAFGQSFGQENRSAGLVAGMTSFYIVNNVQVSFNAFALGMLFGLGSVYILLMNGAMVGAMAALVRQHGMAGNFWAFVSSHGGIELTAIFISGAAGMMVGSKLINPGPHTRVRALIEAGREAGLMLYGMAAMLCVAAVIEAGISPQAIPNGFKYAFGAVNLVCLVLYFALLGRAKGAAPEPSARDRS